MMQKQKHTGNFSIMGLFFVLLFDWVRPIALYPVQSDFSCSIKVPTLRHFGYNII